ncbi:NupC/NupG family nucleoside CNT transporter [Elongatibacter sediminis]|uniref:Nucleoside transporter C-terminal domain-containing protein n=1 Tax=Elongatibacter sediminis TaxID=3119006 RepID=A0AAW9R9I5_9GAMM
MENLQGILGLVAITLGCAAFSFDRKSIRPGLVVKSLALQFVFALLLLKLPGSQHLFRLLNQGIAVLQDATRAGTSFIFGHLGGGAVPYDVVDEGAGVILAFQTLPLVIVISVLSGLLIYSGILPVILRLMSLLLEKTLRIGGAPGFAIVANAFLGMVEAPLLIRPYLARLSSSELFSVMVAGMATIAGSMMAIEAAVISDVVPDAVGHLFSASLITLPGVVYVSHLLMPNTGAITSREGTVDRGGSSVMDVVARSTQVGLQIFLNIIAMAIVVVALVYLVNAFLGLFPGFGGRPVTLERLLGYVLAPMTWLMGIPWRDALVTGELLGAKTVLTEFIAYVRLGELSPDTLGLRSRTIIAYALCGFANFISLGIMVTGLITMVPERRDEIIRFGFRSLIAGSLATFSAACVVGILL